MRTLTELTGCTPLQMLRALDIRVWVGEQSRFEFDTSCPVCGAAAGLEEDHVLCEDPKCAFGHSRVIDLLAHHVGGYTEVVARLQEELPEIRTGPGYLELPAFSRTAHLRFWLRDQLLNSRGRAASGGVQALGLVRKSGFTRIVDADLVKVLDNKALKLLKDNGYKVPQHNCPCMALWTLEGEFAGAGFMDLTPPVTFFPKQVMLGWSPDGVACLGIRRAIQNTEMALRVLIPVAVSPSLAALDLAPPEDDALQELGNLMTALPNATIAGQPVETWLLQEITRTSHRMLTTRANRILACCPISTALQFRIEDAFQSSGNLALAMAVHTKLQNRTLFSAQGFKIRASSHGYIAEA